MQGSHEDRRRYRAPEIPFDQRSRKWSELGHSKVGLETFSWFVNNKKKKIFLFSIDRFEKAIASLESKLASDSRKVWEKLLTDTSAQPMTISLMATEIEKKGGHKKVVFLLFVLFYFFRLTPTHSIFLLPSG